MLQNDTAIAERGANFNRGLFNCEHFQFEDVLEVIAITTSEY
jgi:hypothetical protein